MAEQYRSLSSQIPTMYMVLVTNSMFLQFAIAADRWNIRSYLMSILLGALAIWRITSWRRRSRAEHTPERMQRLIGATPRIALVVSVLLAGWSIQILLTANPVQQSYVPLFAALSTITCAACLMALPLAAYIVIGAGTAPIASALLLTGEPSLMSTGVNLLLIAALMIGMVHHQHLQLRRLVASHAETRREKLKVQELALSDQVTSLPNRRAFLDVLLNYDVHAAGRDVAVAMLDLDGFKAINDTFGHIAGDRLLAAVARRLETLLVPGDMLARLGGDEFAFLMRDVASLEQAELRMVAIAQAFEDPFLADNKGLNVRTSVGVAHAAQGDCPMIELLHRADLALYESKNSPTREICGFEAAMEQRMRRRVLVEQAATEDEALAALTLKFQPIFCTRTMTIDGFEALARWDHPVLGKIPPAEFIAIAERRGITHRFTAILLRQALDAAARWPADLNLSFNLSAVELNSPSVSKLIFDQCAEHGFSPARLSIEVTETALLGDFTGAGAVIKQLRAGGVRVLLDDFGAGFASIGYLRRIQFDGIKLDGSLIAPITHCEVARKLLLGVLQLCRAIGSPVTAEMVETHEHLALLEALGVDKVQGYLLGMPLDRTEVEQFLARPPMPMPDTYGMRNRRAIK